MLFKGQIENTKDLLRMLGDFKNGLISIFLYGAYDPPEYIVFEKEKLIYISISKCGCSSIKKSLAFLLIGKDAKNINDDYSVHLVKFNKLRHLNDKYLNGDYTIFTCIRDPLKRLSSCYESKYRNDAEKMIRGNFRGRKLDFDNYLFRYLRKMPDSFDAFLNKIFLIPLTFQERHFRHLKKSSLGL